MISELVLKSPTTVCAMLTKASVALMDFILALAYSDCTNAPKVSLGRAAMSSKYTASPANTMQLVIIINNKNTVILIWTYKQRKHCHTLSSTVRFPPHQRSVLLIPSWGRPRQQAMCPDWGRTPGGRMIRAAVGWGHRCVSSHPPHSPTSGSQSDVTRLEL